MESEECEQIVFQKGTDKQKDQKKKQHSELVLKGDAQRDFWWVERESGVFMWETTASQGGGEIWRVGVMLLEKGMATHSSILAWRVPMDRGAWWATVQGVTKGQTQLSD